MPSWRMPVQTRRRPPRKISVSKLSPNTKLEDRLTHASLLLGYLFDYGVDFQRRTIKITGDIDQETFNLIDSAMTEMEAESKAAITIKVDSPGGEVYQAMAIVGRLRESKCQIVTKGYGAVMSAATLILASGDKRSISKHAWFMHHESSYGADGKHSEIKALVVQTEREEKQWAKLMAEFSNETASENFWLERGVGVDAYFSAQDLLKLGVVDELF